MNFKGKVKKGSAVVYVLALMLVTAGYWNFISNESKTIQTVRSAQNETKDENLGDATLVSNNEIIKEENDKDKEDTQNKVQEDKNTEKIIIEDEEEIEETSKAYSGYFEESKLSRDTMYSQTLETYQEILNNENVSEEQKTMVTEEISKLNKEKNAIMICENLISTKGFTNCVIFVNKESISVIVGTKELKQDQIAQIQNIVSREMNAKLENIHIMTKS